MKDYQQLSTIFIHWHLTFPFVNILKLSNNVSNMISKGRLIWNLLFNKRRNRNHRNLPIMLKSKQINTWIGKDLFINWLLQESPNPNQITNPWLFSISTFGICTWKLSSNLLIKFLPSKLCFGVNKSSLKWTSKSVWKFTMNLLTRYYKCAETYQFLEVFFLFNEDTLYA